MSPNYRSVSLHMIVKDEVKPVWNLVTEAAHNFDDIYLTVSDKTAANKLKKLVKTDFDNPEMIHVDYREWTDNFSEARNHNWEKGKYHDYSFWLDADDEFDFSTIPELVDLAREHDYDAIYLPYNYAQDETGRCIAKHWRERLIRRSHPFDWRGVVHETLISDTPYKSFHAPYEVKHLSTSALESLERNHAILVKAVGEAKPGEIDPRHLMYLGLSHHGRKEHREALKVLTAYTEVSGWDEEIYRALCTMSEAAYQLDLVDKATEYAMRGMAMFPSYPQTYWLMAQYENDQGNYPEALEWAKGAETKPIPDTMAVVDPTCIGRCRIVGAQACFMLKRYTDALKWLLRSDDPLAKELLPEFKEMAETETFFKVLPNIRKYFKSVSWLWDALEPEIKSDTRARGLRDVAKLPSVWDKKSIVFFCGQGYEEWGPHTLDKGMGGSEEAVIYLSRELAKLGWQVDIFNEVNDLQVDESDDPDVPNVLYHPWREFDERDNYNVFVSWRSPIYTSQINAKVKIVDVHDVLPEQIVKSLPDATYFFKSDYHRKLYPDLPDEQAHIIGNGIAESQF